MARRVSWANNSSGHLGTYVYRAPTLDPQNLPAPVATVDPVTQGVAAEWVDTAAIASGEHCYAVQDFDGQGVGVVSSNVCVSVGNAVEVALTVPSGSVSSDLTGFVTYVDLADMPAGFWDSVTENGAIRVRKEDGTDLPTDVVWAEPNSKVGAVFFRADLSSIADNDFRVVSDPDLSPLAVNDPLGRNAVWQDYDVVTVLGVDPSNRTGGGVPRVEGDPETFSVVSGPHAFTEGPHQGVAWDGGHWYLFDTNAVHKYDAAFNLVASNLDPIGDTGLATVNHLGDGTYHDGFLYTVLEEYPAAGGVYDSQYIVKIDPLDLSVVSTFDISAQGHEVSSICHCGKDDLFYVSDYLNTGSLYKYQTDGTYVGMLSIDLYSTPKVQGVEWFAGAFWLVSDDAYEVYRVDYDGTPITTGLFGESVAGNMEGICAKAGRLVLLEDPSSANSYIQEWAPLSISKGAGGGYKQAAGTTQHIDVPASEGLPTFTMSVTAQFDDITENRAAVSYQDESSPATNQRVTMAYSTSQGGIGLWDSDNSWLTPSTAVVPDGSAYRLSAVYNGTSERRFYINGTLEGTDSSITGAPAALDRILIGREDDDNNETFDGQLGFAYLRPEALSVDWMTAEHANLSTPSSFYSVTGIV